MINSQVVSGTQRPLSNDAFKPGAGVTPHKQFETLSLRIVENTEVTKLFFVTIDGLAQIADKDGIFRNCVIINPISKQRCNDPELLTSGKVSYIALKDSHCSIYCDSGLRSFLEPMAYFAVGFTREAPPFALRASDDTQDGISVKSKPLEKIVNVLKTAIKAQNRY